MKLERIQAIYTELEKYVVQLHPDPRSLGPVYLNDQIATTRNHLNAVSRIQLEVHQEKQYLAREIRAREAALQVSADDLLANDERVRRLPSIEDRKATVSVFLRADKQAIESFKALLQDVEYVEKAVKHRHKELTSTMSEIKLQRSLIRDEIDTGAMYGDERESGTKTIGRAYVSSPLGPDMSEEELEQLLSGNKPLSETKEETVVTPEAPASEAPKETILDVQPDVATQPETNADEQQIDAFLNAEQTIADVEKDIAEIFAGL